MLCFVRSIVVALIRHLLTYLYSKFTPNSDLNYIRTRGSNKLHLPRPQTNFYHSSFEFQGAMHFNNLPENIRVIKGCKQFKAALLEYNNNISQLYFLLLLLFCCCCCFLFSLVALPLCISNQVLSSSLFVVPCKSY